MFLIWNSQYVHCRTGASFGKWKLIVSRRACRSTTALLYLYYTYWYLLSHTYFTELASCAYVYLLLYYCLLLHYCTESLYYFIYFTIAHMITQVVTYVVYYVIMLYINCCSILITFMLALRGCLKMKSSAQTCSKEYKTLCWRIFYLTLCSYIYMFLCLPRFLCQWEILNLWITCTLS